jgi:DNA polymerase-3 subunit gamma/tau
VIATAEKLDFEPAALALVARAADGSMRDGLSLLDQLIAFGGGAVSEANARAMLGTIDRGHVVRIVEALSREDGPGLLAQVAELDRDAPDYDRALAALAALLQRIAIVQIVPDAAREDEEFDAEVLTRLSRSMGAEDVQLYYQIALAGRRDLSLAPDPRLGFEMTLLRMLAFRPDAPAAGTMAGSGAAAGAGMGRAPPTPAAARGLAQATVTPIAPAAPAPPMAPAPPSSAALPAVVPASVDAASWPRIVEGANLGGMVRQFALNCVPASFERDVLTLRLDEMVDARRSPAIEDKLLQALTKYLGRSIRLIFEVSQSELATPARQRALADQDKVVRAAAAFEADPVVKGLQERFGAAVDMASVKPAN